MSENQEPETPEISSEVSATSAGAWDDLQYGFVGNPTTKLDDRGRLKIPAEFRSFIERKHGKGFNAFYITGMDGESAEIYPMPEWVKRLNKICNLPQTNPARKMLLTRYNLWGDRADMDPQGRVQIPEELRNAAELVGEVKVSGEGTFLRVTSVKRMRESVAANPMTPQMLDTLSESGI